MSHPYDPGPDHAYTLRCVLIFIVAFLLGLGLMLLPCLAALWL